MNVDACFRELLSDPHVELRRPSPRLPLADLRAGAAAFMRGAVGPSIASIANLNLRIGGGRELAARRYACTDELLPGIVFFHGGGFVFGDLDTHDAMCRSLAAASGAAVIAIDYRRAPEHPFPAALEDGIAAVTALQRDPTAARLRRGALALSGESAGGHIAIGAAIAARDAGVGLAHLALLYPVIEPSCDSASMHAMATGCLLSRSAMQWYWDCYVPGEALRRDPRVDLLAANVEGLPSTALIVAGCDPLRDECEAFGQKLARAGVVADVRRYAGMVHGFAGLPQITPVAEEALAAAGRAMGRALGTLGAAGV